MKSPIIFVILIVTMMSCNENKVQETPAVTAPKTDSVSKPKQKPFADVAFTSKKDLVCGMPVRAGIEDTAHYNGGIYGFCAAECKEEFLKSPEQYIKDKKKKEMKQ